MPACSKRRRKSRRKRKKRRRKKKIGKPIATKENYLEEPEKNKRKRLSKK